MRIDNPRALDVSELATEITPMSVAPQAGAANAPAFQPSCTKPETLARIAPAHSSRIKSNQSGRALDLTVATLLLILVLPLMGFCVLAVLATSRGPILFRHPRIGRNGEIFTCLKFRTMAEDADIALQQVLGKSTQTSLEWAALHKLKRDPRVTPVGAYLRRYCLDELPQLFNVLSGEMSIVGPRPIVAAEVDRYGENFAAYCSVKPGLTGLWQVSGRHRLPYSERVELDAEYARSNTLSLDVLILWKTVPIVLRGDNE